MKDSVVNTAKRNNSSDIIVQDDGWYSIVNAAKIIGCGSWVLYNNMRRGLVAYGEPTAECPYLRVSGKEIKRLREILNIKEKWWRTIKEDHDLDETVQDEVWYSLSFTLRVLGCPRRSFYRYMKRGLVTYAEPTEGNPRRRFLGKEIKRFFSLMKKDNHFLESEAI